jgi:hypothetical protein
MMLTVEVLKRQNGMHCTVSEVAICCDPEGLEYLISRLGSLRAKSEHLHLMTPSWAGEGLSEQKQGGDDYELVNHLRIVHRHQ